MKREPILTVTKVVKPKKGTTVRRDLAQDEAVLLNATWLFTCPKCKCSMKFELVP